MKKLSLQEIIEKDILECEQKISSNSACEMNDFEDKLCGKYFKIIDNFDSGLDYVYDTNDQLNVVILRKNLNLLKEKLELFYSMDCQNLYMQEKTPRVEINNNNSNSVEITISFEQVRKNIENMGALPDKEVEEILSKISDLEKIVQSNDRKTKKWEDAKGIVKWIADKGVDVGISLLPLLLQIK